MSANNTIIPINLEETPYGYIPSRNIAITFIVLFSVSTLLHLGQLTKYRLWWLLPTVCLCGAMEIAGWAARLWSSYSPLLSSPFQMQITLTIIGPTPLLAANFIVLGEIIKYLGPAYSRLSPRMYSILFCTCDVVSLFVQGAGGGIAATADTHEGAEIGSHVMLGGIAFQLFVIVTYSLCGIEFFVRYMHDAPFTTSSGWKIWEKKSVQLLSSGRRAPLTKNLKIMIGGLIFNTTALFIRAIYRTIELVDGWNGPIITNELFFNVLDGAMIILAIYTLNFIHPGRFLEKVPEVNDKEMRLNQVDSV
ncbi:RTA1 like protein-domain-containing protein [Panaeolus papilionaceus]|nr:RTA1 like protein-domain-containing protein [Panaeolus papilionaceus]